MARKIPLIANFLFTAFFLSTCSQLLLGFMSGSGTGTVEEFDNDTEDLTVSVKELRVYWYQLYGGSADDAASKVQQTIDGGYIAVGESHSTDPGFNNYGGGDGYVVKLTEGGEIEWQNTYGSSENDSGSTIRQLDDGSFFVVGKPDGYTLKLDRDGSIDSERFYGLGVLYGTGIDLTRYNLTVSMQFTNDLGFIIGSNSDMKFETHTGGYSIDYGDESIYVVKISV